MNCTIIKFIKEEGKIIGVLLQVDNGDTQYMTMDEIKTLNKKRKKS